MVFRAARLYFQLEFYHLFYPICTSGLLHISPFDLPAYKFLSTWICGNSWAVRRGFTLDKVKRVENSLAGIISTREHFVAGFAF